MEVDNMVKEKSSDFKIVGKFQIEEILSLILVLMIGMRKTNNDTEKRLQALKAIEPVLEKFLKEVKEADQIITTTEE